MVLGHFERIRIFLEVARTKSFTDTSKVFGISQPAVTQHIQILERQLEKVLFKRSRKKICLTTDGKMLHQIAKKIEKSYEKAALSIESRYGKNEIKHTQRKWTQRHIT